MRNNRGITIIVLIVTIAIMMILVGVSIRFIVDEENGILQDAGTAKQQMQDKMDEQEQWTKNIINEF